MEETLLSKTKKLQAKNYIFNVLIYVFNAVVVTAIFMLILYFYDLDGKQEVKVIENFWKTGKIITFFLLVLLLFSSMFLCFFFLERDYVIETKNSQMMFFILEISIILTFEFYIFVTPYLSPVALVAILTSFLIDRRSAFFNSFIYCILVFFIKFFAKDAVSMTDFVLMVVSYASCIAGVLVIDKAYSRIKILLNSFLISIYYILGMLVALVSLDTQFTFSEFLVQFLCLLLSGPLAAILFMIILPFLETIFNKVTRFKLSELTDHKSKLIRRLIDEAPGTFNHCLAVSNIAESCATAIGEDALLARACAYYHDIGKLRHPNYFSENYSSDEDPHKDLTPELSTNIIKAHAIDGFNLLEKHHFPKEIASVCREHHGTMPILYFYDKAKKFTDGEVNIANYCYAGPKPQSKISAIIMIADSSEAVVRVLDDHSREKVRKTVEKIVSDRMEMGQFEECDITLKELSIITNTVVNSLSGIYHNRVEYPKIFINREQKDEVKDIKETKENEDVKTDN